MAFKLPDNELAEFLNTKLYGDFLDIWSLVHLGAGVLLALMVDDWKIALGIVILWEVLEVLLWGVLFRQENFMNVFFDIVLAMVGFFAYKYFVLGRFM